MKILGTQDSNTQTTNTGAQTSAESLTFIKKRHEKFLLRFLDILPGDRFASLETSRMTILFFAISGLDVLGKEYVQFSYASGLFTDSYFL